MARLTQQMSDKVSQLHNAFSIQSKRTTLGHQLDMALTEKDIDADGWVHDDSCGRMGWLAVLDALTHSDAESIARITDSKLSIFQSGQGPLLAARTEVVFSCAESSVIRAQIFRVASGDQISPERCIAEYTATASLLPRDLLPPEPLNEPVAAIASVTPLNATPLSPKQQAMEIKRRKIYDGACDVIGSEGYAATTIRKVAKAAGVPISTMYQYIETKEDLLFMITSQCMEEIFQYMTTELTREGDAITKITQAVDAYLKYVSKNRRYINLAYRETRALSRVNREKIFEIERRFTRLWEEIIIAGNDEGVFSAKQSRLAANMVYFFCNVWSLRYWSIQDYSEGEVKEQLLKFIMAGLE